MKDEHRIVFRQGKKVYLRPHQKEDAPLLAVHINDQETVVNLASSHPISLASEEKWIADQGEQKKNITFAIVENETDELVGNMSLHGIDHLNRTATTGFGLRKKFWSKGYGTEALVLLLIYAFDDLNLRKINSSVYDFNERSQKLHLKVGYKEEGRLKEQRFRGGRYVDEIRYGLFRDDFFEAIKKLS